MTWNTPTDESVAILELLQLPTVGPVKVRKAALAAATKTPDGIRAAFANLYPAVSLDSESSTQDAAAIVDSCRRYEVTIVSILDPEYPELLRGISDPPPLLYVRGEVSSLLTRCVAVVGTREASERGLKIARLTARIAVQQKFTVVSGLALGIDTAAHSGALEESGLTIAILAHGLDVVAPSSNKDLAKQIEQQKGALVSEHPPFVPPRPPEFVRRNRLQCGISYASIIVESGRTGGAIHQAHFAHEQGRLLAAVVPEDDHGGFRSEGGKFLIEAEGAIRVRTHAEVEGLLFSLRSKLDGENDPPPAPTRQGSLW